MSPISALLPLGLVVGLYATYLRLSARLLGRSRLEWKDAFAFALLFGAFSILGRVSLLRLGLSVPLPFSLFLGAGAQLLVGGWFFSTRARSTDGHPLGWRRAVELVALTLGLLLATVLVFVLLFRLLPR